jgi:hypothetical protein
MRRRQSTDTFTEPSLVPLADMLTNTVGIMLFILIFTVLATSTAAVGKYLPHEHPSTRQPLMIVCAYGHVYPVDFHDHARETFFGSRSQQFSFADLLKMDRRQVSDNYFDMETRLYHDEHPRFLNGTKIEIPAVAVFARARPDGGEDADAVARENGEFAALLRNTDPDSRMIFFFVYGDSVDVFQAARKLVVSRGFEYGWSPRGPDQRVGTSIFGQAAGGSSITAE